MKVLCSRVRKKDARQLDATLGDSPHCIHDSGVLEKQDIICSNKLLAITQFGEDSCHRRPDDEALHADNENTVPTGSPSKPKNKRKHSDEIQGSKYSFSHAFSLFISMCWLAEVWINFCMQSYFYLTLLEIND